MENSNLPNDQMLRQALHRLHEKQPQQEPTPDFAKRVMARIGQPKTVPLHRRPIVWLAAACAAAIIVATITLRSTDTPQLIARTPHSAQPKAYHDTLPIQLGAEGVGANPTTPPLTGSPPGKWKKEASLCEGVPLRGGGELMKPQAREAMEPTACPLEEIQAHTQQALQQTDKALAEAENAVAMLCESLDKGLTYIENINNQNI